MSLAAINPIDNPEAWHVVTVKGVKSPYCEVGEGRRQNNWDKKKGKGTQGAYATYTGLDLIEFDVTFLLFRAQDFGAWDAFLPLLKYDPTKQNVQAIDFYHPSFEGLELSSIVVDSVGNVLHKGGGLYTVGVKFLQFRPPPKVSAVSSPTSSAAGPGAGDGVNGPAGTQPDPAVVATQKEFDNALADAKSKGPL